MYDELNLYLLSATLTPHKIEAGIVVIVVILIVIALIIFTRRRSSSA